MKIFGFVIIGYIIGRIKTIDCREKPKVQVNAETHEPNYTRSRSCGATIQANDYPDYWELTSSKIKKSMIHQCLMKLTKLKLSRRILLRAMHKDEFPAVYQQQTTFCPIMKNTNLIPNIFNSKLMLASELSSDCSSQNDSQKYLRYVEDTSLFIRISFIWTWTRNKLLRHFTFYWSIWM